MAPQKSPAFQFYARDFLTGVATMSLAERGAYITLLAHQWDAGAVPSAAKERARILGCTAMEERQIWSKLVSKFTFIDEVFRNGRLEEEREKQAEYRRRQSNAGRASAATRRQPEANQRSTTVEPPLQPEGNSSSAFASAKEHSSGVIVSPLRYEQRRRFCAFVGSKIEVPNGLHAELRDAIGGPNPEKELQDWYLEVNERAELEAWRIPKDKDFYPWFKALYGQKFPAPAVKPARSNGASLERLEAIARGEIKR